MDIAAVWRVVEVAALEVVDLLRSQLVKLHLSKQMSEIPKSLSYDQDAKLSLVEAQQKHDLIWYRSRLRKSPYWARAHYRVAELSLDLNDIPTAYSSLLAVIKLTKVGQLLFKSEHLLAKVYLRAHSFQEAANLLEKLINQNNEIVNLKEDLAAAYIGLGKLDKAYDILSRLGANQLTGEGHAALSFLKRKINVTVQRGN